MHLHHMLHLNYDGLGHESHRGHSCLTKECLDMSHSVSYVMEVSDIYVAAPEANYALSPLRSRQICCRSGP